MTSAVLVVVAVVVVVVVETVIASVVVAVVAVVAVKNLSLVLFRPPPLKRAIRTSRRLASLR